MSYLANWHGEMARDVQMARSPVDLTNHLNLLHQSEMADDRSQSLVRRRPCAIWRLPSAHRGSAWRQWGGWLARASARRRRAGTVSP